MPTEFISLTFPTQSTELKPIPGAPIDPDFLERYARNLDDYAYNYTLVPYDSSYFDPFTVGAVIAAHTKNLKIIIALRPNTKYPTVAAKALATLDQLSRGRAVVHFIAGGSDAEQAKEGDFLNKEERYARLEDYIKILRRAWESPEPFDWDSPYYKFKQFSNAVRPVNGQIPVSVGGSSGDAYRIGGSLADIFGLWVRCENFLKVLQKLGQPIRSVRLCPRCCCVFLLIVIFLDCNRMVNVVSLINRCQCLILTAY